MKNKKILLNLLAILIAALFLFPVYWIIVNSLKTDSEIFMTPPTFFPKVFTLSAYTDQLAGDYSIFNGLKNSIIISFSSCAISMLLSTPAAYGLGRFEMKGKKTFILSFLITQMLPVTLLLTPLFLIFKKINLLNLTMAPILANCTVAIPFVVITLRPYFKSLPKSLEEASTIDGCSSFRTFFSVMLPIAQSGLVTSGVFSFLFAWNDLVYSLTFLNRQKARPLTAGIYNFISKYGIQWNYIMAFSTLIVIPVILIFIFLQKFIVAGLTAGSVKE
jgi:multiple sugar transport system permease protein